LGFFEIWHISGELRQAEILPEFIPLVQSLSVNCMLAAPLWDIEEHLLGIILVANKPGGFTEQ
jgi:hypothetical protein